MGFHFHPCRLVHIESVCLPVFQLCAVRRGHCISLLSVLWLGGGGQTNKQNLFSPLIAKVCFQKVWQCNISVGLAQSSGSGLLLLKPWINPLLQLVVLFIGTEHGFLMGKYFQFQDASDKLYRRQGGFPYLASPKCTNREGPPMYRVLVFSVVLRF